MINLGKVSEVTMGPLQGFEIDAFGANKRL